jgi:DNA-binding HxlR family transcriptional regulator
MKTKHKCNVHKAVDLLGKKWTLLIIHQLCTSKQGFNDLMHNIEDINPRALSECLKEMAEDQLLIKTVDPSNKRLFKYSLTNKGAKLKTIVEQLGQWAANT